MDVFCVGESHLGAVVNANNARQQQQRAAFGQAFVWLSLPEFTPNMVSLGETSVLNAELEAEIKAQATDAELMVLSIAGNHYNLMGLLKHPVPFDFVLRERPDLPLLDDVTIVPEALIEAALRKLVAHPLSLLQALASSAACRAVQLESPPPNPSEQHILGKAEPYFQDRFAALGVAPALLRYKLWRLHSKIFRQACAQVGVEFVAAPEAAMDGAGFLIERAWGGDATHASQWYGDLVIDQISQLLQESPVS